jgi:hypothetical protein
MKNVLTRYLSWVFIALGIFFLFLDIQDQFYIGVGTWNLNQTVEGAGWLGISSIPPEKIIWRLILICAVVYTFIRGMGKNTHLILSSLHVLLALTCFVLPEYWYALDWTYPILNAVLLALNLMYAFLWNKDTLDVAEDILDA